MVTLEESRAKIAPIKPTKELLTLIHAIDSGTLDEAIVAAENLANAMRRGQVPNITLLPEETTDGSLRVHVWGEPIE